VKTLISLIAVTTTFFVATASADSLGKGSKDFEKVVAAYQKSCSAECQAPYSEASSYDVRQPKNSALPVDIRLKLEQVALDQAQVWGDTILEGDYYSEGNTQLDRVYGLYEDGKFIGYKITYSEHAWYTGECDFSPENLDTLNTCNEGRIHESTFVSPDFGTYFRDDSDLANFEG
jgi:hypothetical protein